MNEPQWNTPQVPFNGDKNAAKEKGYKQKLTSFMSLQVCEMEKELQGKGKPNEVVIFAAGNCGRKGKLF